MTTTKQIIKHQVAQRMSQALASWSNENPGVEVPDPVLSKLMEKGDIHLNITEEQIKTTLNNLLKQYDEYTKQREAERKAKADKA